MDLERNTRTPKFVKERILRFKPVAFVRRNIVVFTIILLFSVSLLIGMWKIEKYEIFSVNCEVNSQTEREVGEYINSEIKGKNFFLMKSSEIEEGMFDSISYVKTVKVEKEIPNKLSLFVEVFEESLIAELSDGKCYLLSNEGFMMTEVCVEEEDCCQTYAQEVGYPHLLATGSGLSVDINGKERLLVMVSIEEVMKVVQSYGYLIQEIVLEDEILSVTDSEGHKFVYDLNDDVELQLQRFLIVVGKIQAEEIPFKFLDLRFERPVVKN